MPSILVVDDDSSVLQLLAVTLSSLGEVTTATDGEEALDHAAATLPDLVVLDVGLPGISGLDVLRTWRDDERTAGLVVVLLSGRDEAADEAAGYDAGADAYVTKPVDVDVLESLLATMVADSDTQQRALLSEFRGLATPEFP